MTSDFTIAENLSTTMPRKAMCWESANLFSSKTEIKESLGMPRRRTGGEEHVSSLPPGEGPGVPHRSPCPSETLDCALKGKASVRGLTYEEDAWRTGKEEGAGGCPPAAVCDKRKTTHFHKFLKYDENK